VLRLKLTDRWNAPYDALAEEMLVIAPDVER